jgi:hypothetical protein
VLDHKYHEKSNDGRAGIDHQLPGIGKIEKGAGNSPGDNDQESDNKGQRAAGDMRHLIGELLKNGQFLFFTLFIRICHDFCFC